MSASPPLPDDLSRLDLAVAHHAQARPDAPALRQQGVDGAISFAALEAATAATAQALAARGLRGGDRLMIVTENSIAAVVLTLAAWRAGAIAAPVNARLGGAEIARIAADADPRLVAYCPQGSPDAAAHGADAGAGPLDLGGVAQAWITATRPATPEPMPDPASGAARPAVVLYTTGTTGRAKGVVLGHHNLIYGARASATGRAMGPGDLILGVLPVTHVFGLTSILGAGLLAGAQVWLWPRFDAGGVLEALDQGATVFSGVPQMHAQIMAHAAHAGRARLAPARLRYVSSGAAPLDPEWKRRAEAFYGTALQNGYGMTETTAGATLTANPPGSADTSVGPPLPGCDIRIRPTGADAQVGEVMMRGPNIMLGYFRNAAATAAAFDADGFLHSGDLGRIDAQGRLHIVGRLKELIIRGGFNVYPPEVEAALNDHPDVAQTAVVGRAAAGDEQVIAFVQPRPGTRPDPAALAAHAAARLAGYKRPAQIVLVDALPAAPSGKILKHRLLALFADRLAPP